MDKATDYQWAEVPDGPLGVFERGVRAGDARPIVARSLPEFPAADARRRLVEDAEWSTRAGASLALQPLGPVEDGDCPRLVLDAGGFFPLAARLPLADPLTEAPRLAAAAALTLGGLHELGIVHSAVTPQSLWVSADLSSVRVAALEMCFADSGALQREPDRTRRRDLRYLAPELSTSGMAADRRADFYALGVVLYEALAGRLPFDAADSVALHHAHSAIEAPALEDLCPGLPRGLSAIVAALLAKDPTERYQSAVGLLADLGRADGDNGATVFQCQALRLRDRPVRPAVLVGREREKLAIRDALEDSRGRGFALLSGASGNGKSALVDEAVAEARSRGWMVATTVCDRLAGRAFAPLTEALATVLAEIDGSGGELAERLTAALDALGKETTGALRPMLPELATFLPASPPGEAPVELPAQAAERRVHAAFAGLLGALGSLGRPVTVVIDDLQWADVATLTFLRELAERPDAPPVLFLLVHRDDERRTEEAFEAAVAGVRAHPSLRLRLEALPLASEGVAALVAHCLDAEPGDVATLASRLAEISQGSPLFVVEEIFELWRGGQLRRDAATGRWRWESADGDALPYSERLGELVARRLARLPGESAAMLARAACLGKSFDLRALAAVFERQAEDVRRLLAPAVRDGLLVLPPRANAGNARFGHDQIRSAAYALLRDDERAPAHLAVGQWLLEARQRPREAVLHLNEAAGLLREQGRAHWLTLQNLAAARLAWREAAFDDAYGCLRAALDLLHERSWQDDYETTRDIHLEAARAGCLSRAAATVLPLLEEARRHARSDLDAAIAGEVTIEALKVLDRFEEAVDSGLASLARLGVHIAPGSSALVGAARLFATHLRIRRTGIQRLPELPPMADEAGRIAMRILAEIATTAFLVRPALFPAIVDAQLRLSLSLGNSPHSSNAYALHAVTLAGPFRMVGQAHDMAVAALRTLGPELRAELPRTFLAVHVFVMPWTRPLRDCLPTYLEASQVALETGQAEFANYHASSFATFGCHAGPPLEQMVEQLDALRARVVPLGQQRQYAADIYHQFCINLRSDQGDPMRLAGPIYDEATDGARHADATEMNGHRHLVRLMLAVLFERYEDLDEIRASFRAASKPFDGMYVRAAFFFYEAVALLRAGRTGRAWSTVAATLVRLRRWQRHCPVNFAHKVTLLRAEVARRAGRLRRAQSLYEEAALAAEKGGFWMEAALACEGARDVAAARDIPALARHCLEEARRIYRQWGAAAKLRELAIRFPASALPVERRDERGAASWGAAPADLDLAGILEASQALSAGMDLEATLERILTTVVGLSGAQRGLLLDPAPGGFAILASAQTVQGRLRVEVADDAAERQRVASGAGFAASVVADVVRSGQAIILADPATDSRFRRDPHLLQARPRALLCCPVAREGRPTAVLYLEHDLRRDAFGQAQVDTIRMLSTQAAISLENARLFAGQLRLSRAAQRFVPYEFLRLLGKRDVDEVALSDHTRAEMTVLVCDIRGFSTATEAMTPEQNFAWINEFFALVGPTVRRHRGFVIKYTGDGLMAVFPGSADDAAEAALDIAARTGGTRAFDVGIGLHTGPVAVGAVGERDRVQADVMSDAVVVACRLESLTRQFDVATIVSSETHRQLGEAMRARTRSLGSAAVKGRVSSVEIYALD